MVVVDSVDHVVEHNQRALDVLALGEEDRQSPATDVAFTQDAQGVHSDLRVAPEGNLNLLFAGHWQDGAPRACPGSKSLRLNSL